MNLSRPFATDWPARVSRQSRPTCTIGFPDDVLNGDPRPRPWDVLSDPYIVADINGTVDWLRNHEAIRGDCIGVTGFCMGRARGLAGGGLQSALRGGCALLRPGNLLVTWGAGDTPPFQMASNFNCPMLFHFGEVDENPSQERYA